MDEKKNFVLVRRNRKQETISSKSKSSPQHLSKCRGTDMTSSINVDSKVIASINLCKKCYGFGMTDRSTFPCTAKNSGLVTKVLFFIPDGQKLVHGGKLICDHDKCKASRSFLYCALGNHVVPFNSFGKVHVHECFG